MKLHTQVFGSPKVSDEKVKIRALVCRSGLAHIEEIDNDLKAMQAIVGGYVEHVALFGRLSGLDLWLNEEGRLKDLPVYITPFFPEPLAGDFFITRSTADGELKSLYDLDLVLLRDIAGAEIAGRTSVDEQLEKNAQHLAERGPGLSYGYGSVVLARDRDNGHVLLGGLGGMGVGQMWVKEEPHHATRPGFDDAPDVKAPAIDEKTLKSFLRELK